MIQRFLVVYPKYDTIFSGIDNADLPFMIYGHEEGVYIQNDYHGYFMIYENKLTGYWKSYDITDIV
jgi:hypothetical protein